MERSEQVRDEDRPSSDLIKELKQLHRQLVSMPKAYRPVTQPDGAANAAPAPDQQASSREQVEQRIHHLEAILRGRGHL